MIRLLSVIGFIFLSLQMGAQCECEDCPVDTPANVPVTATLSITGATNDQINENGQRICQVCIDLEHEAIREMSMELTAPDGSSVELMINDGLAFGPLDFVTVCFLPCDETVTPDGGNSDNWTATEFIQGNGPFTGTYHPSNGCLETDLTGDINGTWTLNMMDNVGLFDGTLNNFDIVFADADGIDCQDTDGCTVSVDCLADGGDLPLGTVDYCIGDTDLDFNWSISYPSGNEPDTDEYGYDFIISENGVIQEITATPDLSSYPAGTYTVCGFSYLLNDASDIPTPNGSLSTNDIQDDIDNELYCADITDVCTTVNISDLANPLLSGPTEVCAGTTIEILNDNFNPDSDYLWSIFSGSFSLFILNSDESGVLVEFISGPGELCLTEINPGCGDVQVCIDIEVNALPDITIIPDDEECSDTEVEYTFDPSLDDVSNYTFSITNGTLVSVDEGSINVLWDDADSGSICYEYSSPECDFDDEICYDTDLSETIDDFSLGSLPSICQGQQVAFLGPNNAEITQYNWSITGGILVATVDNTATFEFTDVGNATVCLSVENQCGEGEEVCIDTDVNASPEIEVDPDIVEICNLSTTLVAEIFGGSGDVSWSTISGSGTVDFSNPTDTTTDADFSDTGDYEIEVSITENGCTTRDTVEVSVIDGISVENYFWDCDIDGTYTVSFNVVNGTEPYTVDGTILSGNLFTSTDLNDGDSYSYDVADAEGCMTEVIGSFDCPCFSYAGTMDDQGLIEICISSGQSATGIHNSDEILDLDDIGAFFLHTASSISLGTVIATNSTGTFAYDPNTMSAGVSYYISYVVGNNDNGIPDTADGCLSVAQGIEVIFYDSPIIDIENFVQTCETFYDLTDIENPVGGSWSIVNTPPLSIAFINASQGVLEMDIPGIYTLQYLVTENGCESTELIEIELWSSPEISNVELLCANNMFTVSFEVLNGTAPYEVNGTMFTGNTYTSMSFASGENYTFIITDENGCQSPNISGTKLCDCEKDAGTMSNVSIDFCPDDGYIFAGDHNDDATPGPDDIGIYILHNSANNILGTILNLSEDGVFIYDPLYGINTTLYISYVIGNELNDQIDLNDPCLSVSPGQAVNIGIYPEIILDIESIDCQLGFIANVQHTGNNGYWTMDNDTSNYTLDTLMLTDASFAVSVSDSGNYEVYYTSVIDQCTMIDSAQIALNPLPSIDSIVYNCNEFFDSISATIYLNAANDSLYYLNDHVGSSVFMLSNLSSPLDSLIELSYGNDCILPINLLHSCNCDNATITITDQELNLCQTESLVISSVIIPQTDADPPAQLQLVVFTDTLDLFNSIVHIFNTDSLYYTSELDLDQTYFAALFLNSDISTGIDFTDPCLSYSEPFEFTFNALPTSSLSENAAFCFDSFTLQSSTAGIWSVIAQPPSSNVDLSSTPSTNPSIDVDQSGTYLFQLELENLSCIVYDTISVEISDSLSIVDLDIDCNEEGYTISYLIEGGDTNYTINGDVLSDNSIDSIVSGFSNYTVSIDDMGICDDLELNLDIPCDCDLMLISQLSLCNDPDYGSTALLDTLFVGDYIYDGTWSLNGQILNNQLDADAYAPGSYELIFESSIDGCDGDTINLIINECLCEQITVRDTLICQGTQNFEQSLLISSNVVGNLSLLDFPGTSAPNWMVGSLFNIEDLSPGVYQFLYQITSANPEICPDSFEFQIEIEAPITIEFNTDYFEFCENELDTIDLSSFVSNSSAGYFIDQNDSPISPILETESLNDGNTYYSFIIDQNMACPSDRLEIQLVKNEIDPLDISLSNISCFGENDGMIIIEDLSNNPLIGYSSLLNDLISMDDHNYLNLEAGIYNIEIIDPNGCSQDYQVQLDNADEIIVELEDDLTVNPGESLRIEAFTNLEIDQIASITWNNLGNQIGGNDLSIDITVLDYAEVTLTIEDLNGCTASDTIVININELKVYVPNVFNPNSTSGNNRFFLHNTDGITNVEVFIIYDRWGNIVFKRENELPQNIAWDGTLNNRPVESGVYVYQIQYTAASGPKSITGDLTLLK